VAATGDGLHLRVRRTDGLRAASGRIDLSWALLYAAAIFWDLGFDTIYAHQDREDDALVGVRSTARLFGERTRPFLAICYAAAVVMFALAGWSSGLGVGFISRSRCRLFAGLAGRAAIDIHDPERCLAVSRQPGGRAGLRRWRS
jgi:4-hydroxybenzoate polyprenyltransferase